MEKKSSSFELEIKFFPSTMPQWYAVMFDGTVSPYITEQGQIEMRSVYFDTPDLALRRLFASFRQRDEGGLSVYTLKFGATSRGDATMRNELEVECVDMQEALDSLNSKYNIPDNIQKVFRSGALAEIATMNFSRNWAEYEKDGDKFAFSFDSGNFFANGESGEISEIEVELRDGSVENMLALSTTLAEKYALTPSRETKLKRALLL